ncbi:MAG: glycoside hydrolase family 3 C-terminal domain-containing protein, partial [Bacteroidales bacterium]|nr:glycoside hydrolase family 3 C-terminal domain-containing protein [Candidatus Cacconaster equifaecalis]
AGKPTVLVLLNGRPLSVRWAKENVNAIVEAWEPDMLGGQAIAEVLWGKVNPSGKLPVTIPWNEGQIPTNYNYKPMKYSRQFVWGHNGCLYPFGYGLSYTQFSYGEPKLEGRTVSIDVTNSGEMDGTEIVQLYIHDEYASVTRPVKELKGFERVELKAGETRTVSFEVTDDMLKCWGIDDKWSVEPGDFSIMVGSSSADEDLKSVTLTVA